jgi:Transcriptional regulators
VAGRRPAGPRPRHCIATIRAAAPGRLDETLEGIGLSYAQYEVMERLAERPNLHAGELGRRLRITRQTAHGLLKQLVRADLIDLLPPDGGARPARLTTAGRRRLELGRQAVSAIHSELEQVSSETRLVILGAIAALDVQTVPAAKTPWWFG